MLLAFSFSFVSPFCGFFSISFLLFASLSHSRYILFLLPILLLMPFFFCLSCPFLSQLPLSYFQFSFAICFSPRYSLLTYSPFCITTVLLYFLLLLVLLAFSVLSFLTITFLSRVSLSLSVPIVSLISATIFSTCDCVMSLLRVPLILSFLLHSCSSVSPCFLSLFLSVAYFLLIYRFSPLANLSLCSISLLISLFIAYWFLIIYLLCSLIFSAPVCKRTLSLSCLICPLLTLVIFCLSVSCTPS